MWGETMRISIKAVKEFAKVHKLLECIVFGWDGDRQHVATYGTTVDHCANAAELGNRMKKGLGWTKHTDTQPSRVKKLMQQVTELEQRMGAIRELSERQPDRKAIWKLAGGKE